MEHRLTLSRPTADADDLWTLLRDPLDRMNLGHGVEAITLLASRPRVLGAPPGPDLARRRRGPPPRHRRVSMGQAYIDRMVARFGAGAVCRFDIAETHAPQAAFIRRPWSEPAGRGVAKPSMPIAPRSCTSRRCRCASRAAFTRRSRAAARSRQPASAYRRLHRPDALLGRWWLLSDPLLVPTRDYFKLQDESGRWWWVYRQLETGRWFLHGQWA